MLLQRAENHAEACRELERAIQLRPRDYFLWMLLGISRDLKEDQEGAERALRQAIALSPAYAKSRWLLGNLLLRMNRPGEGFSQLRLAAVSDETLWPNVIDLAWGFHRGDAAQTVAEVQPQTSSARMSLAIFLAGHNQPAAALEQFRAVSSPSAQAQQNLIKALLSARAYAEAYTVWTDSRRLPATIPSLLNPDLEDEITLEEGGFGWQIASVPNVVLSADPAQFQRGKKSLRIDFHGDSSPTTPVAAQLIVLHPRTSYRLTFYALTKDYVSTGAPVVVITDASDANNKAMAQSLSLSEAKAWREFSVDFTTAEQTDTVRLSLLRQGCSNNPCAAFGTVWLDSFELKSIAGDGAKGK
jgi:Tfp pilus assembly protein PilF